MQSLCWLIANWNLRNTPKWNLKIQQFSFENVGHFVSAITVSRRRLCSVWYFKYHLGRRSDSGLWSAIMTSWHVNAFRITVQLSRECYGFPSQRAIDAELRCSLRRNKLPNQQSRGRWIKMHWHSFEVTEIGSVLYIVGSSGRYSTVEYSTIPDTTRQLKRQYQDHRLNSLKEPRISPSGNRPISWLLLPWLLSSPGHQHPRYWLYRINCSCLPREGFLCHRMGVNKW